jgi:hypothetical protein
MLSLGGMRCIQKAQVCLHVLSGPHLRLMTQLIGQYRKTAAVKELLYTCTAVLGRSSVLLLVLLL